MVDDPLRTGRTAVTRLEEPEMVTLVFGAEIDPDGDIGTEFFQNVVVAGVYERRDGSVEFGHLHPELSAVDYLIPIPSLTAVRRSVPAF